MFKFLMFFLTASICSAQMGPQQFNANFVRGVFIVTPVFTITQSPTFTPTITPTPFNTPAAGTNTWTPTLTPTVTNTPTITNTPTKTGTPNGVGLSNANGTFDNWKDAAPQGTSTPGTGQIYDQTNAKFWQLSLQGTNNICTDLNGNTCTPTPTGSPTGTPINTPTPNYQTSQVWNNGSNGITFFSPNGRNYDHFGIQFNMTAGSSAITFQGFSFIGNTAQFNAGDESQYAIAAGLNNSYFSTWITNNGSSSNGVANGLAVSCIGKPSPTETALAVTIMVAWGLTNVEIFGAPSGMVKCKTYFDDGHKKIFVREPNDFINALSMTLNPWS